VQAPRGERRTSAAVTLAFAFAISLASPTIVRADPATALPTWLALRAGTYGRVDLAPWPTDDEPEAALTAEAASLDRDFTADLGRPNDVVYEPVGVRVRIVRLLEGGRIALVRGAGPGAAWRAYAPVDRIVPEVPPGTMLRAAGGFEGFADFFPSADALAAAAGRIETGTPLVALAIGAARDPAAGSDLVRIRVRVLAGAGRGRTGWIPAAFTGLPVRTLSPEAETAAKACRCRILRFEGPA
jgi:hypothetical protein